VLAVCSAADPRAQPASRRRRGRGVLGFRRMVPEIEAIVVGAGVVGLAVARALARAGREVVVLEAATAIGTHTSSRNSEVIHAGIYYPAGSLKARMCVQGREALYRYCQEHDVPHRRIGKLLVAVTDDEIPSLDRYAASARANGVTDLVPVSRAEAAELEPSVRCVQALLSPSTGIIDSHALMQSFRREAEAGGARVVLAAPVLGGRIDADGIEVDVGGSDSTRVRCRILVNAAGLYAQRVASTFEGLDPLTVPPCHYAKGHYFVLSSRAPFRRLVYPMPVPGGLGVHVTLDLGGQARFGPDVDWVSEVDYAFDESRAAGFYEAIRRYFPGIVDGDLTPGYTGIRPKLGPATSPAADFVVQGPADHGVPGLVNLYGIESPGLTASLAIADEVARRLAP
jgi:L-2-hydroxyglutarate oxidase LhgO